MQQAIHLALIYGSAREGRFCDTVAGWAIRQLEGDSRFKLTVIDPAALGPLTWDMKPDSPQRLALTEKIGQADAFLVVTPEYNHGYPAALKHVIDAVYAEWQAKPVAFISYGGMSGGLRAVEQLRQVFAELHAVTMRDSVALPNTRELFDDNGQLIEPEGPARTLAFVMSRLHWWAVALRNARLAQDYSALAA